MVSPYRGQSPFLWEGIRPPVRDYPMPSPGIALMLSGSNPASSAK